MAIYKKVTDLVGNTPILELGNYEEKNQLEATILAKLEYFNPAGSVKDRIAREIILDALETGKLTKDYALFPSLSIGNKAFFCFSILNGIIAVFCNLPVNQICKCNVVNYITDSIV